MNDVWLCPHGAHNSPCPICENAAQMKRAAQSMLELAPAALAVCDRLMTPWYVRVWRRLFALPKAS
jgi:hypothetical protein